MAHPVHPSALARFSGLLRLERADLAVLGVYAGAVALLTLAVPLAMQALVNTLSAGIFLQPVVVLTLMVLGGLLLAGFVQLLQYGLIERLQQRVFARTALDIADRLARVRPAALRREYAPELADRFFDVLTVQKSLSKMLMDGLAALAQAVVGVLVLGLFSPSFLLVAVGIVTLFALGQTLLGLGGLRTSLRESVAKYRVALDRGDRAGPRRAQNARRPRAARRAHRRGDAGVSRRARGPLPGVPSAGRWVLRARRARERGAARRWGRARAGRQAHPRAARRRPDHRRFGARVPGQAHPAQRGVLRPAHGSGEDRPPHRP